MNIHTIAQLLDIADPDSSITDIRIEGDYFGRCEVEDFENFMKGTPYNPEAVRARIDEINIDDYFSGTDTQQFLTAMF